MVQEQRVHHVPSFKTGGLDKHQPSKEPPHTRVKSQTAYSPNAAHRRHIDSLETKQPNFDDEQAPSSASNHHANAKANQFSLQLFQIPLEVVHRILSHLDPDTVGAMPVVSGTWSLIPDDSVYKVLCERVYLSQTRWKQLRIERWPSWKHMFLLRPRIRTNGVYVLRTCYIKAPHLDMWTQMPAGSVLEVVYYRYFRFYDDGTVLYSLNHTPPNRMLEILKV